MRVIAAILLAATLIFGGLYLNSVEDARMTTAIVNLADSADKRFDQTDQKVEDIDHKVDMLMYGQSLLAARDGALRAGPNGELPPIVIVK